MRQGIQLELKDQEIKEYGCYALCIIQWAELETSQTFDDKDVKRIIGDAKQKSIIGPECFVKNPPALFNLAAQKDLKTQCLKTTSPVPTCICCNKKPMYTHFTLWHDGKTWDPLPPGRPSAKAYKPDSWRVLS